VSAVCGIAGVLGAGTVGPWRRGWPARKKDTATLNQGDSFPDANVAYISRLIALLVGPLGAMGAGLITRDTWHDAGRQ
jgi:hypothetical protein